MLPRLSLRNPIGVLMVSLAVVVLGVTSFQKTPVDLFPDVPVPVIIVGTLYPGATPEVVEQSVTYQIERAVSQASNLWYTESLSRYGLSTVAVWFRWGADVNAALLEVSELVKSVTMLLPPGTWPPISIRFDISRMPLARITMEGPPAYDDRTLYDIGWNVISPQIAGLPGIARGRPLGGVTREVVLEMDAERMRMKGVSIRDVDRAIRENHLVVPAGQIRTGTADYNVFTNSMFRQIKDMNEVVVKAEGTTPIRVADVGRAMDGSQIRNKVARVNGKVSVYIDVYKVPGANTVEAVRALRAAIPKLQGVPGDIKLDLTFDQAVYVENALSSLTFEVLLGGALALVVILLFLGSLRATLIVSLSLPLSFAAAFLLLYLTGQTLNIFTLGGLALSVGILVDDAIVVLENIHRHHERGADQLGAALAGTQEVMMPVRAATLTTCIIFMPLAFLTGIAKYLFVPLAFAATYAIVASHLVSMSVVPAVARRLLPRDGVQHRPSAFARFIHRVFNRIEAFYERLLGQAMRHRGLIVVAILGVFGASLFLVPQLGTEFFPETDESQFAIRVRLPVGKRVEETNKVVAQMEQIVMEVIPKKDLRTILSNCGTATGFGTSITPWNTGPQSCYVSIELVQPNLREVSVFEYQDRVRARLEPAFPGIRFALRPGGIVQDVLTFGTQAPIDVEIRGHEIETMRRVQEQVSGVLKTVEGLRDVFVNREYDYPQLNVLVDRDQAALMGIDVQQVAATMRTSIFGNYRRPPLYFDPDSGNPYFVVTRLQEKDRTHIEDLGSLSIIKDGRDIPFKNIARVVRTSGPPQFDRRSQQRVIDVLANPVGRDLGSITAEIEEKLAKLELPPGVSLQMRGQAEEQRSSFRGLVFASLLALALVYMVLAAQYKSLLHPFITMFTVPVGFAGVFAMLYLTKTSISTTSLMGMIMMVGIVVRNGVLLVNQANSLRLQGLPLMEATLRACRERLRPILMTAIATILGLLPMALAFGVGSESNAPLARAVIGGLAVSTFLTLFLVPALYTLLEARFGKERAPTEHERRVLYPEQG